MADNLSPEAITSNLGTEFIGQRVVHYSTLSSTMDGARQEARWGAPAGTVVVAEEQTAARGRLSRPWFSPRGCLSLSVILRPGIAYLPNMIMLASLAVARAIEQVTGLKAEVKWPNDVLIHGKKVCGILIESEIRRNSLVYVIIGIGINVNLHLADFPDLASAATSLSDESGREVSRLELVRRLLIEMERLYRQLAGGDAIYEQWRDSLVTLGKDVRVQSGETVLEGVAESVSKDGSLLVCQQDGRLARVVAGDATILRK